MGRQSQRQGQKRSRSRSRGSLLGIPINSSSSAVACGFPSMSLRFIFLSQKHYFLYRWQCWQICTINTLYVVPSGGRRGGVCQQIPEGGEQCGGREGRGLQISAANRQAMTMRQLMKSMPWIIMLMNLTSFELALDAKEERSRSRSRRRYPDPVGPSDALPH